MKEFNNTMKRKERTPYYNETDCRLDIITEIEG